ncbi:MAG: precorrin-2 C(20)-methyltransferase [Syntrophothermus sp.]|uniref:precorrin-2 C(20)-methyltransferase n=1 Tax=Syntrophothermus sp. TaxID=2736299 RepID=UPI00257FF3E7|nr:precorrin-2 C(20)-methyltransferase [Syntrophothermus sp.]NSW82380.1 precorrin-2 C(20)-methyltransferase [Syntrophothermus sp.]
MLGVFYGIGVGSGDPELLTLKACKTLRLLDVLITPVTAEEKESLAYNIVRDLLNHNVEVLFRRFPMSEDPAIWQESAAAVAEEIRILIENGKNVGFVTLGDPMFYSTYVYLLQELKRRGIDAQTIPGISSVTAACSKTGVSLAEKNERIAIVPAVYAHTDIQPILDAFDTVVFMKVKGDCSSLIERLERAGMKETAVFVSRLGLDNERIVYDLDEIRGCNVNYLSLIIARKKR